MNFIARDRINGLLEEFGSANGMGTVGLDDSGVCAFDYKGMLDVVLELASDGGTLHLYSTLCKVPAHDREEFLAELLERNLLCAETNGATLAVDGRENQVVLCFNVEVDELDSATFSRVLENFLDTSLAQQAALKMESAPNAGHPPEPDGPGDMLTFGMRI